LRDFWGKLAEKSGHRFRDNEHLCAVCATKRLLPKEIFGRAGFPSTSSMAVAGFVRGLARRYADKPAEFSSNGTDLVRDFVDKARAARLDTALDFDVEPLPGMTADAEVPDGLLKLDGDWYIRDTYDELTATAESDEARGAIDAWREALARLLKRVDELDPEESIPRPRKYYAIVEIDADDIGRHIRDLATEGQHAELSRKVARFAGAVPNVIEQDRLGCLVYSGGDEALAFLAFDDLLEGLSRLRAQFGAIVGGGLTASAGAVIAHHKQGLRSVLAELRRATARAKALDFKDGFCVAMMKRSGGTDRAAARWRYDALEVLPFLQELVKFYRGRRLSASWWRDLHSERYAFENWSAGPRLVDSELVCAEARRLIGRHWRPRGAVPPELVENIKRLVYGQGGDWEGFVNLMGLASYIAKGGGE
ncbi:hypothetical protein JXD38_06060, partial [candidate division WOR-3 bacterium]|nr:hypothetical protein [candidate division WOR-3 bacterium]